MRIGTRIGLQVGMGLGCALLAAAPAGAQADLFTSRRVTPPGEYTAGTAGPAIDARGALFVANFGSPGTIGRLDPGVTGSAVFATLPAGSVGKGIRSDARGRMFVADYRGHAVFVLDDAAAKPRTYFRSDAFAQPNDLAVAPDGTLYASDPAFRRGTGRVWRIDPGPDGVGRGAPMRAPRAMGRRTGSTSPRTGEPYS